MTVHSQVDHDNQQQDTETGNETHMGDSKRQSSSKQPDQSQSKSESANQPIEMTEDAARLLSRIEAERDEAIAARQRALADFANYQRRAVESERRAVQSGSGRVMRSIIHVLDQFDFALGQPREKMTVEQILGGMKLIRDELFKALKDQGLQRIEPEVGEPFDPNRHEAMLRQPAEGVEPGCVSAIMQPGYALGEQMLRPAKVAVAPGEHPSTDTNEEARDDSDDRA